MTATISDDGFRVLLAVLAGQVLDVVDGRPVVVMSRGGRMAVESGTLDEIEGKGWLDLSGEVPRVTESGRYWAKRFADRMIRESR